MKKIISVPLLVLAFLTFVPVINANNNEDIVLLETIKINPDFHELIELREEIIKLYEIDPQGTQFAGFTPTCIAFISVGNDTYTKIRALDERGTPEDINDINTDAVIKDYRKFHVDASEYKETISLSRQVENVTTASIRVMEELNSTFYEKVREMNEVKKHLELSMEESKGEILTLQRDYALLQNYSNSLALRHELEKTYSAYNKKLRNSMLISFVVTTIAGILIGFIIALKWEKRVEYLSLYMKKVKVMHPLVYACVITIVVFSLMFAYIYMKDAYSIFSYLIP